MPYKDENAWSSTNRGSSVPSAPRAKRTETDGRPLEGVEVRIVDDDGHDVRGGEVGEIWSRGPDLFAGYTVPELTAAAVDGQGWYATGDMAVADVSPIYIFPAVFKNPWNNERRSINAIGFQPADPVLLTPGFDADAAVRRYHDQRLSSAYYDPSDRVPKLAYGPSAPERSVLP